MSSFPSSLRTLADAAWLAALSAPAVRQAGGLSRSALVKSLWQHSRSRLVFWAGAFQRLTKEAGGAAALSREAIEQEFLPLAREFFLSDFCVRVWSALLTYEDGEAHHDRRAILANNHRRWLQVRAQILSILVEAPESNGPQLCVLDQLRRRCERWSDLLIGEIGLNDWTATLVHDVERLQDWASEPHDEINAERSPNIQKAMIQAGRAVFRQKLPDQAIDPVDLASLCALAAAAVPNTASTAALQLRQIVESQLPLTLPQRDGLLHEALGEGARSLELGWKCNFRRVRGYDLN